jgi:hypothetical protein
MEKQYKLVVYVPLSHAEQVRHALGEAGAGVIGDYGHCTFSVRGVGRFLPMEGANPHIGEVGKLEAVEEERIETVCRAEVVEAVLEAVRAAHPYEEPAIDVYPIGIT